MHKGPIHNETTVSVSTKGLASAWPTFQILLAFQNEIYLEEVVVVWGLKVRHSLESFVVLLQNKTEEK